MLLRCDKRCRQPFRQLEQLKSSVAEPLRSRVAEPLRSRVAEPLMSRVAETLRSTVAEPLRSTVAEPLRSTVADDMPISMVLAGEEMFKKLKLLCLDGGQTHSSLN